MLHVFALIFGVLGDFDISTAVNDAITAVGTQLQAVLTGGALSVVGLIMGGMAALGLLLRLVRRAIHTH